MNCSATLNENWAMDNIYFGPGLYLNIFSIDVPNEEVDVLIAPAKTYPSLQELRSYIVQEDLNAYLYRYKNIILLYGQDAHKLNFKYFRVNKIKLFDYPQWCSKLIIQGLIEMLKKQGYRENIGKGRIKVYESENYSKAAAGRINVFRSYDLRTIYFLKNQQPIFGLIVDICWEVRDLEGRRLNIETIVQYGALSEIAQIQEEYLSGNKINPEVSRLRLQNHILPFVAGHKEWALPLAGKDINVVMQNAPLRVIIGVE